MFILFKMCCVNVGICILFYDFILKFLFLYFSDIIEDKLDMMMECKKELEVGNLYSIDGFNVYLFEFYFEYYVYDCDDVFMELVYILEGGYM